MGAGFAIAMRDLESRGAGNILGTQQSGHIAAVGYELYCELLEQAVRQLKKMPPQGIGRRAISICRARPIFRARYVPDMRLKIDLYRRLRGSRRMRAVTDFASELADRFGPVPAVVEQLLELARLRIWRTARGIHEILAGRSLCRVRLYVAGEAARREQSRRVDCGSRKPPAPICRSLIRTAPRLQSLVISKRPAAGIRCQNPAVFCRTAVSSRPSQNNEAESVRMQRPHSSATLVAAMLICGERLRSQLFGNNWRTWKGCRVCESALGEQAPTGRRQPGDRSDQWPSRPGV